MPLTHFIFFIVLITSFVFISEANAQIDSASIAKSYRATADKIIRSATADSSAYNRLAELCDKFGHRLSGSSSLEQAIDWIIAGLKKDQFQNVRGEEVFVPNWSRGNEYARMISPRLKNLTMLSLGGSQATPPEGITAPVLVVNDFDDLEDKAALAKGKIILFNTPFTSYGQTVRVRVLGAIKAAAVGAVASMIRSVGPFSMNTPHTGGMTYSDSIPKIPHIAIASEDADMMSRMQHRGEMISVQIYTESKFLPDARSRNVIAELKGSEKPDEIVVFGGHIDSWDVGTGAMDDGGGCIASWEALKIIKSLNLKPRRTLRLVMWTNEENGTQGAEAYATKHANEKHVFAFESDEGVFKPLGFGYVGTKAALEKVRGASSLLESIGATKVSLTGGGADIEPLMMKGVPGASLDVDGTKYFWYHHTNADTIDKLRPNEMSECVAAIAVLVYIMADAP
jgi:carboxypeptidase Q